MLGFHPEESSGAPDALVQATTGNATATSPVIGIVVVVTGAGSVVDVPEESALSDEPQPATRMPAVRATTTTVHLPRPATGTGTLAGHRHRGGGS